MTASNARLILAAILVAAVVPATAGPMIPTAAIASGIERGILPPWAAEEHVDRIRMTGGRVYVCLEHAETGQRWPAWGPAASYTEWLTTGHWEPAAAVAGTAEDWAACGWPEPKPVAIGEPAYLFIAHTAMDRSSPLDWHYMNAEGVKATTTAGEPCSPGRVPEPSEHPDPAVGWHTVPGKGISRCRMQSSAE